MITLLVGFPGSGKSTYVQGLNPGFVTICPDEFRKIITGRDFFGPLEEIVWFNVKTTAKILLSQDIDILVDATNLTVGQRAMWIKLAQEYGTTADCIWFQTPYEECLRRNRGRDRVVPDNVMEQMKEMFQPPTQDEGFYKIVVHGGEDDRGRLIVADAHGAKVYPL